MDIQARVTFAKKAVTFISTKFDETDDEIKGALTQLVEHVKSEAEAITGRRKAIADAAAAKAKEVADAQAAHTDSGAAPLPTISADLPAKG